MGGGTVFEVANRELNIIQDLRKAESSISPPMRMEKAKREQTATPPLFSPLVAPPIGREGGGGGERKEKKKSKESSKVGIIEVKRSGNGKRRRV